MHIDLGEQGWQISERRQEKTGVPVCTIGMAREYLMGAKSSHC